MKFETVLLIFLGIDLVVSYLFWCEIKKLQKENKELKTKLTDLLGVK